MLAKDLQDKALHMNALDKIHLVELILDSLDKPDSEIEKVWVNESDKRYLAYKKGNLKGISLDAIRKRFEK